MKRYFLYAVIVIAACCIPVNRQDVAKLQPVELISLYTQGEQVVLATDTGDVGAGNTLLAAYDDLERTTPGVIYLDTAEYLLVTQEALPYVRELVPYLRTKVKMCLQATPLDPEQAVPYLTELKNLPRMSRWESRENTPVLEQHGDRIKYLEKSKKMLDNSGGV